MEEHRAFPHERFALRRLVAGTLTSQSNRWDPPPLSPTDATPYLTGSVLPQPVDIAVLARNVQLVAEALARYMFDLSDSGLVTTLCGCEV